MIAYRKKELASLLDAFHTMQENKCLHTRFIASEIGWGKTALLNQFLKRAAQDSPETLFISSYCSLRSEYSIPYQPFKDLLKQLIGDMEEDEEAENIEQARKKKKKDAMKWCAKMVFQHAPSLVGNFIPGVSVIANLGLALLNKTDGDHEEKKEKIVLEESKILEQYVDLIQGIAKQYTIVLIIEDLQWIDKSSVHLLYQLIQGLKKSSVMIIGLYRSADITQLMNEEDHPLITLLTEMKTHSKETFIELDRLSEAERRTLMHTMLDSENNNYDKAFREDLFARTNGNPLFVRELMDLLKTQDMVVKNPDGVWVNDANVDWTMYPARIEGIIKERIGKLHDSLVEILTYASVQGHNFIAQVLSKTMETSEKELLATLSKTLQKQYQFVQEGKCMRSGTSIVSYFAFSNSIFQQYLYHDLSPTQKMLLHGDIGRAMEALFQADLASVSGEIARHFEMSGEYEGALKYIHMTVEGMMLHAAYQDAALLCNKALTFLRNMPQTESNTEQILYFTLQICTCLSRVKGWGAPETSAAFEEGLALTEELGCDVPRIRHGICRIHMTKLELHQCLEQATVNLQKAQASGDVLTQLPAVVVLGNTYLWLGRFKELLVLFAPYIALEKEGLPALKDNLEQLYLLMYTLLAASKMDETELETFCHDKIANKAKKNKDHFYRTMAYHALSWHACFSEKRYNLDLYATQLMEHAQKYDFTVYTAIGKLFYGSYLAGSETAAGNIEEGIKHAEEGYAMLLNYYQCEPFISNSIYGCVVSRCYLQAGMLDACRASLDKAIGYAEERHDKCYLDNLYLLQARYYKAVGNDEAHKACLEKALHIAQSNGAVRIVSRIKKEAGSDQA